MQTDIQRSSDETSETVTGELIDPGSASLIEADLAGSLDLRTDAERERQRSYLRYVFVPLIFLTVAQA